MATLEALMVEAKGDRDGGKIFKSEGKAYCIKDKDEVRKLAEEHGYIIIY